MMDMSCCFANAQLASCMLQALVFLSSFKDMFLTESLDVILHSLPDGLAGLNVFKRHTTKLMEETDTHVNISLLPTGSTVALQCKET